MMNEGLGTRLWALVPAAGRSRRLSGDMPKQYRLIDGQPVIAHALQRLARHPLIEGFTVCLAPDDRCWASMPPMLDKPLNTCEGGATRAESVLRGLQAMHQSGEDDGYVLIHDAVRPCVSMASIDALIEKAILDEHGAFCALPVSESLKLVSDKQPERLLRSIERKNVWLAQTPQLYRARLLHKALEQALARGVDVYDESTAMEAAGYHPHLVHGSPANFKLTFEGDLALARRLLERGRD